MSTFYYVPQYFTTQLSVAGGIDDTQTTGIVLQSISGVDETKPGIIAVSWSNPIDTTKVEYITYTSINATTKELQGVTRGEEGYSAKSHVNGATVAWPLSKSHINNIPDSTTTLSNKRINPRIVTAASYTTDTGTALDVSTCDEFDVTAQAGPLKLNNPSGTPVNGQKLIVRIKDNGTAQNLTYDTQFRASSDLELPTTTVLSKTLYMGFVFNSADTKWDLLAVLNNF
jgi:hypothetical protein